MLIDYGFVNKKYAIVSQFFGQFMKEAGSRQAVIQGWTDLFFNDVPQVKDVHHRDDALFFIHYRHLFDVAVNHPVENAFHRIVGVRADDIPFHEVGHCLGGEH